MIFKIYNKYSSKVGRMKILWNKCYIFHSNIYFAGKIGVMNVALYFWTYYILVGHFKVFDLPTCFPSTSNNSSCRSSFCLSKEYEINLFPGYTFMKLFNFVDAAVYSYKSYSTSLNSFYKPIVLKSFCCFITDI